MNRIELVQRCRKELERSLDLYRTRPDLKDRSDDFFEGLETGIWEAYEALRVTLIHDFLVNTDHDVIGGKTCRTTKK